MQWSWFDEGGYWPGFKNYSSSTSNEIEGYYQTWLKLLNNPRQVKLLQKDRAKGKKLYVIFEMNINGTPDFSLKTEGDNIFLQRIRRKGNKYLPNVNIIKIRMSVCLCVCERKRVCVCMRERVRMSECACVYIFYGMQVILYLKK